MLNERKGISTFIATLLLMVLAVSAGVVIYAYTMGYLGGFGGTEQLGAMSIDDSSANQTVILAYIRNIGKTTLNISTAYVDGDLVYLFDSTWQNNTDLSGSSYINWVQITEGEVVAVYVDLNQASTDASFNPGTTYEVKLIAEDNSQVSFSVKAK
jgi:hypothetical protein